MGVDRTPDCVAENKALYERVSAFDYLPQLGNPGGGPERGSKGPPLEYGADGAITVRIALPGAKDVHVATGKLTVFHFDFQMKETEEGIFEAVLPADLKLRGNIVLNFTADGIPVLNPWLPMEVFGSKLVNYIDVADPETPYILLQDEPHGAVTREIFYSETIGQWARCMVYTPPGYERGGEYPVLYLQHGGGENETCWIFNGKLPYILDNAIAEGKAVPLLVVMNNGLLMKPGDTGINDFDGIEGIITKDCRAYIESKYRVKTDKWNRAIAGLSLGSMQASYIGMRHPELFGSIGSFTYLRCRDKDNTYEGNPHLNALKDAEQFKKDYKLLFRSIGGAEWHLNEFEEDDRFIAGCGLDGWSGYVRKIIPGQTHNWNCWRRAMYEFAQVVFR
ncbi:MAG: enterochelin esterase [Lachnospiraceae bacterium]|nr:enterochelin esterase [Lachnospiraceae bacterium]